MSASAMVAAAHGTVTTAQDISIGHVLLQMVVALAIVVGGIWGFGKVMRRTGRGNGARRAGVRGRARSAEQGLTLLSRHPVGKGKSIAVVQVGDQCFLVGIADSGLTPLGELKPAEIPDGDGTASEVAPAAAGRSMERAVGGSPALALAPLELGSIDLAAFAGAATSRSVAAESAPGTRSRAFDRVASAGRTGLGRGGERATVGQPTRRPWLDALREATVRR